MVIFPAKNVSNKPRLRCPRLKTRVQVSWRKQVSVDKLDDTSAKLRKEWGSKSLWRARAVCVHVG